MKRLVIALAVGAGALACLPPEFSALGLQCNEARSCGPGYVCVDERCAEARPDAGVGDDGGSFPASVNLLANPGFELELGDGGIALWQSANGTRAPSNAARTGARAARVRGTNNADVQLTSELVEGVTDDLTVCARAFGRNDFDAGYQFVLIIRERLTDGSFASAPRTTMLPPRSGWVELTTSYRANGGTGLQVRVTSNVKSDAGVLVDDVELFRAPPGGCVFP